MNMSEELQFAVMEAERLRKQLAEAKRLEDVVMDLENRLDDGQKSLKIMVSKSVRIEAELAEKDQLLQRAAEIIRGVPRVVGGKWIHDYESREEQ